MRIYCITQGTLLNALWWPKWEENFKKKIYVYIWLIHLLWAAVRRLPQVWGQGQKPGGPHALEEAAKRSYPTSEVRGKWPRVPGCDGAGTAERGYPTSEIRGGGQEGGAAPPPRRGSCAGAGKPRGAIPRSRSEGEAVRRYPSSKVRSSGCALLEQPWRDTPRPR